MRGKRSKIKHFTTYLFSCFIITASHFKASCEAGKLWEILGHPVLSTHLPVPNPWKRLVCDNCACLLSVTFGGTVRDILSMVKCIWIAVKLLMCEFWHRCSLAAWPQLKFLNSQPQYLHLCIKEANSNFQVFSYSLFDLILTMISLILEIKPKAQQ